LIGRSTDQQDLGSNQLTGSLPGNVLTALPFLGTLDVSFNKLSGSTFAVASSPSSFIRDIELPKCQPTNQPTNTVVLGGGYSRTGRSSQLADSVSVRAGE